MMIYELDEIEKAVLLGTKPHWIHFVIQVNLKVPKFGPGYRRERHEFRFCAQSRDDARVLALCNVPSRGYETELQIIEALPLLREVEDAA